MALRLDVVAAPAQEDGAAGGATGVFRTGEVDIADIDVAEAAIPGRRTGTEQSPDRRRGNVLHAVVGEEPAEMERTVGKAVAGEPGAHRAYHRLRVVQSGDDQIGHFDPHAGVAQLLQRGQHGRQAGMADRPVHFVRE